MIKKRNTGIRWLSVIGFLTVIAIAIGFLLPNVYVLGYYDVNDKCYWHTGEDWYVWNAEWERADNPTNVELPIKNKIFFGFKSASKKYNEITDFKESRYYDLYIAEKSSDDNGVPVPDDTMYLNKITKKDLIEGKMYQLNYFSMKGDILSDGNLYKLTTLKDGTNIYTNDLSALVNKDVVRGCLHISKVDKKTVYILEATNGEKKTLIDMLQ